MKNFFRKNYMFFGIWFMVSLVLLIILGIYYLFLNINIYDILSNIVVLIHNFKYNIVNFFNNNALMVAIMGFIGAIVVVAIEKNDNIDSKKINMLLSYYGCLGLFSYILSLFYDGLFSFASNDVFVESIFMLYIVIGGILIFFYIIGLIYFINKKIGLVHAIILSLICILIMI